MLIGDKPTPTNVIEHHIDVGDTLQQFYHCSANKYRVMEAEIKHMHIFQRLMNLVVAGLDVCAVYHDDIVFSDMWDDHIQCIGALFVLAEVCLTVNLAKCKFARVTGW